MKDVLHKILEPIRDVQSIRGVDVPVGLEFRQLIVTGPPGSGKTHYINQIRGWPNEGYLDLSRRGWWKDRSLIYRPREIHLGIPYEGIKDALAVFDQEWLELEPDALKIDYSRIRLPPSSPSIVSTNWQDQYIFEFLLPDPEVIYERRKHRKSEGYFPVDEHLSLDTIVRQVDVYSRVALFLHRAGLNVYIRKDLTNPPMLISEKGDVALPPWAVSEIQPAPSLKSLSGWKQLLNRKGKIPWVTVTNRLQQIDVGSRIAHDGKGLELILGRLHLHLTPEIPLGVGKRYLRQNKCWTIHEPRSCMDRQVRGFARISPGETVLLGRSNKDYNDLFKFKKGVGKRHATLTNHKGDLIITPLDQDHTVKIVRLEEVDNREEATANRVIAMHAVRELFGTAIEPREPGAARELINSVNAILRTEAYRPIDKDGNPGGLLELPDEPAPLVVGDLHGEVDNLLKILTENCLLEGLKENRVFLCILGDAVHSENVHEMEAMDSSMLIMDLIFTLKKVFPANVFYIRGNHDSFDPELSKNGISQGILMRKALEKERGLQYVAAMQEFYDLLPYLVVAPSFIGVHAGPPRQETTKKQLINVRSHPKIARLLTNNRIKRPHNLSGYGKPEIKALRKTLGMPKSTPVIVGHTPLDPFGSVWQNVGSIKGHHIVYSSHQKGPGYFIRIRGKMIAQSYPAEPLVKLINRLKQDQQLTVS